MVSLNNNNSDFYQTNSTVRYFYVRHNGVLADPVVFENFGVQWQLSVQKSIIGDGDVDLKLMCLGLKTGQKFYVSFITTLFSSLEAGICSWRHDFNVDRHTVFMRNIQGEPLVFGEPTPLSKFNNQVEVQFTSGVFHKHELPMPVIVWPRTTFEAKYKNRDIKLNKEYFLHFWPEFEKFMKECLQEMSKGEFEMLYEILGVACHNWRCNTQQFETLNEFAKEIGFVQFRTASGRDDDEEEVPMKRSKDQ